MRQSGEPPALDFEAKPHWELGEALGIIDFERGVKLAGSRFYVLKGAGARLQRALIAWMIDLHTSRGYSEVYPPAMMKEENLWAGGWLPKFGENMYHDAEEDYWLLPTAEVALTNMHRDEILEPGTLPINYVAYTPCFRREKMSAGPRRAGNQARAPVRQGRAVQVRRAGAVRRRARDACRRTRRPYAEGARAHATGSSSCAPATWGSTPRRRTTSRSGRRAQASGWRSRRARTAPTSRRGARTSASAGRRARGLEHPHTLNGSASRCRGR